MNSVVGKINLEGLMSRSEILFTAAYLFEGDLDIDQLRDSYYTITNEINKFKHQIEYSAQNDFHWCAFNDYGERFHVFESEDIEEKLKNISADGFQLRASSRQFPLQFLVINSSTDKRFYLAEMCSHEFIDNRSAETIFHLIVDHYNASYFGDEAAKSEAVSNAQQLKTLDAQSMLKLIKRDDYDEVSNMANLENYVISDAGGHGVCLETLPELLPEFQKRRRFPEGCQVDAGPMIEECRRVHPEVTKNAVITAVLHKAIYNINVRDKQVHQQQTVSGKMVADLLTPGLREQYIGNYIAFVPVSSEGEASIADIAKSIHNRIVEFKSKQIDVTCFNFVEQGAEENAVGTENEDLSYVITNWNNYRFLAARTFLVGCESIALHSAVNVAPLDAGGAALINRLIVVINLNFDDQLCFSMFPSLRDDAENKRLVNEVERLFNEA